MKRVGLLLVAVVLVAVVTACDWNAVRDPEIETTSLPRGTVGAWYDFTFESNDAGDQWIIEEGSLPPDLRLDESAGRIYGTPLTAGTYPLQVCYRYTDIEESYERLEDCREFTLTINAAP